MNLVFMIPKSVSEVLSPNNWFSKLFEIDETPEQIQHEKQNLCKLYMLSGVFLLVSFFVLRYMYYKFIKIK